VTGPVGVDGDRDAQRLAAHRYARATTAGAARLADVGRQRRAQLLGVGGVELDLVLGAGEPEPHGLVGLVTILVGHLTLVRPALRQWLPLLVGGLTLLLLIAQLGARPLGLTASVMTISGVLPQVVTLALGRRAGDCDASGVSRSRWRLTCTANLLWVSYGLIVGDPVIIGNSSVIAALGAAIVVPATGARPARGADLVPDTELAIAA
jgi:hypothetical protein